MSKQSSVPWDPFEGLSSEQRALLEDYQRLLLHFNHKVNLISREDEAHAERHIRHVLSLAQRRYPAGSVVVDWGTGGGLPAIPLAICCPEAEMHAVDAVAKKVWAVQAMVRRLGLGNVHAWHGRAEDWPGAAQYSVSRATAPLERLWRWHARISEPPAHAPEHAPEEESWSPALLCLKGGDLTDEIAALKRTFPGVEVRKQALAPLLGDDFFDGKYLVEVR